MGVQASQNKIAREAPHPGLPRWKRVSALPSHAASNCSPPGLSRWRPGLQTGESPIRGQTPFLWASPEGTILSSARGSAKTRVPPARGRRRQRHSSVVQKLAFHRHEAGGGNAIPQKCKNSRSTGTRPAEATPFLSSAKTRVPPARGRRRQRHSSKATSNSRLDKALSTTAPMMSQSSSRVAAS